MGKKTKLNIGCGIIYRPGYINIDKYEDSVADMTHDADDLPFESNTIDTIEALHLIEHFDYIHSIYVLSEWFRILKPEGTLTLETPDLNKSFKKLKKESLKNQKTTLQWLYGIDSCGMQHKTIFTFELLKKHLEDIGFQNIVKEPQKTHKYEPGLRIICKKPINSRKKETFATFRKNLKKQLKIDDSDTLLSLENHCIIKISDLFFSNTNFSKNESLIKLISKSAICNPKISLVLCNTLLESGEITKEEYDSKLSPLNTLINMEFHKKLFTLWSKHKKTIQNTDLDYRTFIENTESRLISFIKNSDMEQVVYIDSQNPSDIVLFNRHVIELQARILFNRAVKQFSKKNHHESLELFRGSIKLNPQNPLSYWNIARLAMILDHQTESILEGYENALLAIKDKKIKNLIKKEFDQYTTNKIQIIPKEPISEDVL
ncbi:MAG: methyltransferase domain-containing protein [archaeon]